MSFITNDVIKQILASSYPDDVVSDFKWDIKRDDYGKGYCSVSFHMHVTYKLQNEDKYREQYLFVKDPYESAMYCQVKDNGFYEKELYMYQIVIPAMHKLLGEECLAPKFFFSDKKHSVILQDLSQENYRNHDKRQQLDFEITVKTLEHLAKFHAVSIKLNEISPEILERLKSTPFHHMMLTLPEGKEWCTSQLKALFKSVYGKETETREEQFKRYEISHADKLNKILNNNTQSGFKVLIHGDAWTNNIMCKYDEYDEVVALKFVDFQLSYWTSPLVDLCYFFVLCVRFENFEKNVDLFLETYVNTLNRTLRSLKNETRLSFEELRRNFDQALDFSLHVVAYYLPMAMADDEKKGEESLYDNPKHMKNDRFKILAHQWLTYFDSKGIFS